MSKSFFRNKKTIGIGSSILVVTILILFIANMPLKKQAKTPEQIILKYGKDFKLVSKKTPNLVQANKHFNSGNYKKAAELFEKSTDSSEYTFYHLGYYHYKAGNFSKANSNFKKVLQTGDTYKEDAEFFYALTCATNSSHEAVIELNKTIIRNGKYKENAREALIEIVGTE